MSITWTNMGRRLNLRLVRIGPSTARLLDEELEAEFDVPLAALAAHTRLRHAITIHLSQSRTLPGRVRVHELRR